MPTALLPLLFFLVAVLYAAVGQGGGSGYLAVMSLVDLPAETMRTTALTLNLMVAGIASARFVRAGYFAGRLFWPLVVASVPAAFVGGRLAVPAGVYRPLVGIVLLYAALQLARAPAPGRRQGAVPSWLLLVAGAGIGLLSGLVGVGGGIFLAPLLLLSGWADARQTVALSSGFVLVNSAAALAGRLSTMARLPEALPIWLLAAAAGGWLGAWLGSRRLAPARLRQLLALVLAIAAARLLLSA